MLQLADLRLVWFSIVDAISELFEIGETKRIWKTYRREADVIYPPVDTERFIPTSTKENFYLTASRFVPYKKIDLIVESFANMPDKKLIVIVVANIHILINQHILKLKSISLLLFLRVYPHIFF